MHNYQKRLDALNNPFMRGRGRGRAVHVSVTKVCCSWLLIVGRSWIMFLFDDHVHGL